MPISSKACLLSHIFLYDPIFHPPAHYKDMLVVCLKLPKSIFNIQDLAVM